MSRVGSRSRSTWTRLLALDKYEVDEAHAHIELDLEGDPSTEEFEKLVRVCPAGPLQDRRRRQPSAFDYAGCLECGTCRIACGDTIVKKWDNPQTHHGHRIPLRLGNALARTLGVQGPRHGAKANAGALSRPHGTHQRAP